MLFILLNTHSFPQLYQAKTIYQFKKCAKLDVSARAADDWLAFVVFSDIKKVKQRWTLAADGVRVQLYARETNLFTSSNLWLLTSEYDVAVIEEDEGSGEKDSEETDDTKD